MTVCIVFKPEKLLFYSPTLVRYFSRVYLNRLIRSRVISKIRLVGTRAEKALTKQYLLKEENRISEAVKNDGLFTPEDLRNCRLIRRKRVGR